MEEDEMAMEGNNNGGNGGNGLAKGLVILGAIAIIMFGLNKMADTVSSNLAAGKNNDSNSETTIVYVNSEDKDESIVPIKDKYSVKGDFYNIFTSKQNLVDNFGNTHETAYEAYVSINSGAKELTYELDESYSYLQGTIYLSEKDKDTINYFVVRVYDEKGNNIYESEQITDKEFGPLDVNCNISGLSRITIELEGCTKTCSGIYIIMPEDGFVFVK